MKKTTEKAWALVMAAALCITTIAIPADARIKKPKLNVKKMTLKTGQKKKLQLKNVKKVKKVTWKSKKKTVAALSKKTKKSAVITAKKPGKTVITCQFKTGKKTYKLNCKVLVKKNADTAVPQNTAESQSTLQPEQSIAPTDTPAVPTSTPTAAPSLIPTSNPTVTPASTPTKAPSILPTLKPSSTPTAAPTVIPTGNPTVTPASTPTKAPSILPTVKPSSTPTAAPSVIPTSNPTVTPASTPTKAPSILPTVKPTSTPTAAPTVIPTSNPTVTPASTPTKTPSILPTVKPTSTPAITPSVIPTSNPTVTPASTPTKVPATEAPTATPAVTPTTTPTVAPTATPTATPTVTPTSTPVSNVTPEIDKNSFTNPDAYTGTWKGSVYNIGQLITSKGYKVSDFTEVKITVQLLDAEKNVIADTAGASVKLSVSDGDWRGFIDVNGVQSDKQFGLQLDTYPSDATALYLVVQNSMTQVKYIRVTSVIFENNGKKDATEVTTKYKSLAKLAEKYGFKFGTNISSSALNNSELTKLIKYHFNSTTFSNEMKAYSLLNQSTSEKNYKNEQSPAAIDFTTADKMAAYAQENDLQIRGHVLTWDADMCDWFFREGYKTDGAFVSAEVMKYRLKTYIEQVMTHFQKKYPGVIYCWDVVNEAVADNYEEFESGDARHVRKVRSGKTNLFYDHIGSDYVELSFQYAYETRKKLGAEGSIKLFYNDYNTFATYGSNKRDAIIELVKSVNSFASDGADGHLKLCDGIGMQSYIGGYGQQSGCMNSNDITSIKNAIEKFAAIGVEVHVTELAVRNYERSEEREQEHAAFYKKLMQTYVDINKAAQAEGKTGPITSLSIWGLFDSPYLAETDYSYKMNGPYCGLFTELYQPKQAFKEVYEVLGGE